eukprot:TRINITY_DN8403_c0_g1_i4.p1 TRINITY_DN8403_c0_g1~~TRINITY_DN8403_c0_g1_i4.p1  ORF type:complete len:168 (-),score=42.29 TRINITY_DN8403_c0_g1_i4:171-674(-)
MEVQRFEADCSSLEVGGKRISIQEESNEDKEYEVMAETTISSQRWSVHSEENVDEWSEDECSEMSASVNDNKQESNKEDVSFSDLEINNDGGGNEFGKIVGSRSQVNAQVSSSDACNEWVKVSEDSEANDVKIKATYSTKTKNNQDTDEFGDWFTINDFYLESEESF